jgi:hypothetical protein
MDQSSPARFLSKNSEDWACNGISRQITRLGTLGENMRDCTERKIAQSRPKPLIYRDRHTPPLGTISKMALLKIDKPDLSKCGRPPSMKGQQQRSGRHVLHGGSRFAQLVQGIPADIGGRLTGERCNT